MSAQQALTVAQIIDDILRREGGYVDHPADRGGATKYGVTQAKLAEWRGQDVSKDEVAALTEAEALDIYFTDYVVGPRFHKIASASIVALVVDCAVNHGTRRAAKWLQRAVGVKADGVVGPVTLSHVNARIQASPGDSNLAREIYNSILAHRAKFYGRLISRDHSQAVFAAGWMARIAEFIIKRN